MTTSETRFWLLRHAPVAAEKGVIVGALDLPCAPIDPRAARVVAEWLPQRVALFESDLMRCGQTSDALRQAGARLPEKARIEPDLREQNLGQWQGKNWNDPAMSSGETIDAFWRDPAHTRPPGGESFAVVVERMGRLLKYLSATHAGQDMLLVMHAGSIRAALAMALGCSAASALRFAVDPFSLSRLSVTDGEWCVEDVNRTP